VLTKAFQKSAKTRSRILGMPNHPQVFVDHPLASKTEAEVKAMTEAAIDEIASALLQMPEEA
jgi:hypothetical protein|tara:strand:- start:23 stop:208 length:186 start_codon:yes stop_codon:yes gene_type:complete